MPPISSRALAQSPFPRSWSIILSPTDTSTLPTVYSFARPSSICISRSVTPCLRSPSTLAGTLTGTVSRIVKDNLQQGEVVAPAGRTGVIHATRKFDALAWEALLYLVQADSQSTLYGEHMPCNTRLGLHGYADLGLYGRTLWRCQSFHDVHHDM